ncbi:MAG: preprotein translocase subunit SecA, partial [Tardiphaga sp.]
KQDSSLHVPQSVSLLHHVIQALYAHTILVRDRDYVVKDGRVVIVDQLTGRLTEGRRYDDGLHQALEAKEHCEIGEETRTLASITYQSYFRKYDKLAGMTGTAIEDLEEYREVYGLNVLPIPPHQSSRRIDERVNHMTQGAKIQAIVEQVEQAHGRGQPVLVGAPTLSYSEQIAAALQSRGWKATLQQGARHFAVLDAKHHEHEARIIAQAGAPGAVTIATAMAGRGTDIKLGGAQDNNELRQRAIAAGGLLVIATEPHEIVRLDRQLRGRAGRQGDPGRTVSHASWDDEIVQEDKPVLAGAEPSQRSASLDLVVAAAQQKNRSRKFNDRRALMRFDTVIEKQRFTILAQRRIARDAADPIALTKDLRDDTIDDLLKRFLAEGQTADIAALDLAVRAILTLAIEFPPAIGSAADISRLRTNVSSAADDWMRGKETTFGRERLSDVLRTLMMALLDQLWCEQTERLEHLRRQVADRRLSAERTQTEFATEAFAMLAFSMKEFRHEVTAHAMRLGRHGPAPARRLT